VGTNRRSGGSTAPRRARRRPLVTDDPPVVELASDDPGRGHELRVPGDRRREPVDVRRLEGSHLTERVSVELPELELSIEGLGQRRARRAAEVADPRPGHGAGRCAGPRRLPLLVADLERRVASQGRAGARQARRSNGLVARADRMGRVHSSGHRPAGLRLWWTAASRSGRAALAVLAGGRGVRILGPATAATAGTCQGGVGVVDLRHLAGRDP
jgi:hypothetical protein